MAPVTVGDPACVQQQAAPPALGSLTERGERTRLHRMQPSRDGRTVFGAPEYVRAHLRKLQRFMRATHVLREMTHAGVDVSRQLNVAGRGGKAKGAIEMPLREPIMAGVVRHPAGHLRQGGGGGIRGGRAGAQFGLDLACEIADRRAIEVSAADLSIRGAKCLENGLDSSTARHWRRARGRLCDLRFGGICASVHLRGSEAQLIGRCAIQGTEQTPVTGERTGAMLPAPDRPSRHTQSVPSCCRESIRSR
jgi:hypothetical protein